MVAKLGPRMLHTRQNESESSFLLRNKLSDKQSAMSTKWFAQWLIIQMKFLSAGRRLQVTKDNNDSVNLLK